MKSVIYKEPGKWAFEDRPKPEIQHADDVLLKVLGVGICGTDLHILQIPQLHPARFSRKLAKAWRYGRSRSSSTLRKLH